MSSNMKGIYWRPQRTSPRQLAVVAFLSVLGLLFVERFPVTVRRPYYEEKLAAARAARQAFEQILLRRLELGVPVNPDADPAGSGLVGPEDTPIASVYGHLPAKRTSINPNFAAVAVELLREAGVERGDIVAVGVSGSFPALNIAVYVALEALGAEAVVIASASASEYGATYPELTWLDMERVLQENGVFSTRAVAASLGGVDDLALGHSKRGRELLRAAVDRNARPLLTAESREQMVEARLRALEAATGGRPMAVYVNVGGGSASVGEEGDRGRFRPGINRSPPPGLSVDSVASELMKVGVPLVNFTHIQDLARRFGLPQSPRQVPAPGMGRVFVGPAYSRLAALVVFGLIVFALWAVTRFDVGQRLGGSSAAKSPGSDAPEQMV